MFVHVVQVSRHKTTGINFHIYLESNLCSKHNWGGVGSKESERENDSPHSRCSLSPFPQSPCFFTPLHSFPPPHPLLNQVCYAGFLKVLFDFSLVSRMFFPRSFLVMIILTVHQNFSFTQVLLLLLFNCLSGSSW